MPRIIPTIFTSYGIYGDFNYMIEDPRYDDSLFIFNDNTLDHPTALKGAGNASIRPYNVHGSHASYPRSVGISTGYSRRSGGYKSLTENAQHEIDRDMDEIQELIKRHKYKRIFFSAEPAIGNDRPRIGTSIFQIGDDVKGYITRRIYSLAEEN